MLVVLGVIISRSVPARVGAVVQSALIVSGCVALFSYPLEPPSSEWPILLLPFCLPGPAVVCVARTSRWPVTLDSEYEPVAR
jgi:hypothetical protein